MDILDLVIDALNFLANTLYVTPNLFHLPLDAVRNLQLLRSCHLRLFLCQVVQPP